MMRSGIAAVGAYVPDLRVKATTLEDGWGQFKARGVAEKAVPDVDEDPVTMAYEAATRALEAGNVEATAIDDMLLATTTPPTLEAEPTAHVGAMLGIPEETSRTTLTGSTAAGAQALSRAARTEGRTLVVASDCPEGAPDDALEHAAGAGAAAFVLEPDAPLSISDVAEHTSSYPGTRFRKPDSMTTETIGVTAYERAALEDVLTSAAADLAYDHNEVGAAAVHAPDGSVPYRAAGPLGIDREAVGTAAVVDRIGDAGVAGALLALANAVNADGTILVAGYGSGATATLLALDRTERDGIPVTLALDGDRYLSFAEYVRRRGDITSGTPDGGGGYVSVPTWRRSLSQRYRLAAGQCPACGSLNFPPTGACAACRELVEYESVKLEKTGTIETLTFIAQGGAPPEFAELQAKYGGSYATGIVSFDGPKNGSASAPAFIVGTTDDFGVGDRVQATMRRIYTQEGVTRYGFKAVAR